MQLKSETNWFVGATWERNDDQTPRFLSEGIWENGYDDEYLDLVRSMRPGNRIVIKSCYTRIHDLPFDSRGHSVAVMAIKAIGTIAENPNDGKRVRVDWEERVPEREWYFSTYRQTIHLVKPGKWKTDGLIAFTFEGRPQDINRFRNDPQWRDRFGDNSDSGALNENENGVEDEDEISIVDDNNQKEPTRNIAISIPEFHEINEQIKRAGHFPPDLCRQLHLGLWTNEKRHFAILTGISGSGKTLLACKYGEALTRGKAPCVIPVEPGWTDPSFLLGYPNPLKGDFYVKTSFLELLLSAIDKPDMPHVAILDEMNLSHPEQYLAPVLSAMETDNNGNNIELHGREDGFKGVPRSIPYPKNLVLIGTVNMDETTMGLSDKVLDRAFTIEFWDIDVDAWPGWDSYQLQEDHANQVKGVLEELMNALKPAKLHFGYRVIDEVIAFLKQRETQTPEWDFAKALDNVIYAKVLPKLRGDDSTRVQTAFDGCKEVLENRNLKKCVAKVEELKKDLESTGSARFWR